MLGSRANALPSNIELRSGALLGANVKASPRESQFLAGAISLPAAWSESSARRACALVALAQQRQVQCAAVERRRLDRARERERERAPVVRRPLPNDPLPKPTLTWFMGFWKRRAPALRASLLHAAPRRSGTFRRVTWCAVLCCALRLLCRAPDFPCVRCSCSLHRRQWCSRCTYTAADWTDAVRFLPWTRVRIIYTDREP